MCKSAILTLALLAGLGVSAIAVGQDPAPVPASASRLTGQHTNATEPPVIKPGDRNCLRDTGSLIRAKPGECLPVTGRSYSGEELRRTGYPDNARALQALDPSISVGH